MRQIAFRAWDSQYKKMLPLVTVYGAAISIGLTLEEAEKHYTEEQLEGSDNHIYGDDDWTYVLNKFELMQFTGLTDKNGKEIYEGDIVHPNIVHLGCDCEVVWHEFAWKLRTIPYDQNHLLRLEVWKGVEVIGNIYSNPELLNNL